MPSNMYEEVVGREIEKYHRAHYVAHYRSLTPFSLSLSSRSRRYLYIRYIISLPVGDGTTQVLTPPFFSILLGLIRLFSRL